MCRSILCPNCLCFSYHKGTCEKCDFDPAAARWVDPGPLHPTRIAEEVSGFYQAGFKQIDAPFPCVRFSSPLLADVDEYAEVIGYRGSFFHYHSEDDLLEEDFYGLDLVKGMAQPVIAEVLAFQS